MVLVCCSLCSRSARLLVVCPCPGRCVLLFCGPACAGLGSSALVRFALRWAGLGRAGLGWVGPAWAVLCWAGQGRGRADWSSLGRAGLGVLWPACTKQGKAGVGRGWLVRAGLWIPGLRVFPAKTSLDEMIPLNMVCRLKFYYN